MTRCTCIRQGVIGYVLVPDPTCPSWLVHLRTYALTAKN